MRMIGKNEYTANNVQTFIRLQHIGDAQCEDSLHTVTTNLLSHFFADHSISSFQETTMNTLHNITVSKNLVKGSGSGKFAYDVRLYPEDLVTLLIEFDPSIKRLYNSNDYSAGYFTVSALMAASLVASVALLASVILLFNSDHFVLFHELVSILKRHGQNNNSTDEEEYNSINPVRVAVGNENENDAL